MRFTAILIGSVFAALLSSASAMAEKTTLNFGIGTPDVTTLDPHRASTTADKVLLSWVFNGLVRIQPGQSNPSFIEPDLAESWESSEDGLRWTFHLRDDVLCHKGYGPLTAEDVVFSLQRAANPDTSSYASDFAQFSSIEAVDSSTVTITLSKPVPSLLGLVVGFQGGNIVCKAAVEDLGDDFARNPVGTGPFVFENYQSQRSVTLSAHEEYFRGAPRIKDITYRYLPTDASRELALMAGEIDIMQGTGEPNFIDRINAVDGYHGFIGEPTEMSSLYLNVTVPPLDDIRVRKALAMAINLEDVVELNGRNRAAVATSVVPSNNLGYVDLSDLLPPYDPEGARALLAEAGYPDGLQISTIHTNRASMLPRMQMVQASLAAIGVDMEINVVDHATFHAQIRENLAPIVQYGAARFPIADIYLTQFFHSNSIVGRPSAVTNFTHCDVADFEIDAARVETDPQKQMELWAEAQRKLIENVCAIPMVENYFDWAQTDKLDLGHEHRGSLSGGPLITETTHFAE